MNADRVKHHFMDTVINHTALVSPSGSASVHQSTQTDPCAISSGSLGPYEVSHVDEVVMFTGCLPDKEVSIEKGRVVVKILPVSNVAAREGGNVKPFSIRFHCLPVNQASENVVNVTDAVGTEDFDWDDYVECAHLDRASISVNTATGSQDSGVDSHCAVLDQRDSRQSVLPAVSEDSASSEASCTEGFSSALAMASSSLDKTSSPGGDLGGEPRHSMDSGSSSLNSANSSFRNGRQICKIAEMRRDPHRCIDPVSRMMLSRLITYDSGTVPRWYKSKYKFLKLLITEAESFVLKSIANGMGWLDVNGKDLSLFKGSANLSSHPLSSKFIFCFENDVSAFERLCEAEYLLANAESQVNQCFTGSTKTYASIRLRLYETLSFIESDENSIESRSRSGDLQLISDCSSAIYFFFRNFISKLEHAAKSKKYQVDKESIARKVAGHTILEKERGNFDLLNACVNYNLAVRLIEREYRLTDLARYDSERRAGERLNLEVEPGDLKVITRLLILIEALEEEGRAILSDYKTCIDALPRAIEGKSFEERVLHMFDSGNGYVSRSLQDIKSTLTTVLGQ